MLPAPRMIVLPELWQRALDYQAKVLEKIHARDNYTGWCAHNRYAIGYVCEYTLDRFLEDLGVRHENLTNDAGFSDNGDQRVFMDGDPVILDVKGTGYAPVTELQVVEAQWPRVSKYDVLVAAVYAHPWVDLMGWCWVRDFATQAARKQQQVWKLALPFDRLAHMAGLIKILDRRTR